MNWKLRKFLQDTLLNRPNGIKIYGSVMNFLNKSHQPEYWLDDKFTHSEFHWSAYQRGNQQPPETVLEIGTGWFPLVPLFLSLRGVKQIITADANPHLNKTSLFKTIQALAQAIQEEQWINCRWEEERKNALISYSNQPIQPFESQIQFLSGIGIVYRTFSPKEGLTAILTTYKIDQVVSNNTLNCVEEQYIFQYLESLFKHLPHKSLLSHHIDLTDPRSHTDPHINSIDFLQYNDLKWKSMESRGLSVNRLRASEWINLFEKAGFKLLEVEPIPFKEQLNTMSFDARFAHLPERDFQIGWLKIIVQKP